MQKNFYRAIGTVLMLGAIIGLLISIVGAGMVWVGKPKYQSRIIRYLDLLSRTLASTSELLLTIDDSLFQLGENLSLLKTASENLATATNDIVPAIDTLADLIGDDYLAIVTNTQTSLRSVQSSAQLVDNTLRIITSLPLIGARYAPEEPIHISIENMIQALEPVPPKLTEIQANLSDSTTNLKNIRTDLERLSQNLAMIEPNISEARGTIQDYQSILLEAEIEVADIQKNILLWLDLVAISITIFIFWLCVVQVAVFTQGMELFHQGNRFFKHPHDPT